MNGPHSAPDDARIRVGVIGAGFIGPAHIESLRRLGYVFDLIDDPDVEVVDISSPNIHHYPAAKVTLEAGKHVVCEKPWR